VAHHLLEDHSLPDDVIPVTFFEQGLLDAREAAAQQADDEIVVDVGLRAVRAAAVEVLQQRDQAVGDLGADVAAGGDGVQIAVPVVRHGMSRVYALRYGEGTAASGFFSPPSASSRSCPQ
jgi:hypothetical protein